ncbi:unnamed protein product [Discula destructiva]
MHSALLPLALLLSLTSALPSHPEVTPAAAVPVNSNNKNNNNNKRDSSAQLTAITITIVNSMKDAISTSIASNAGVALATGGATGTMAAGASASIVAPMNWAGNMAVGLAKYNAFDQPTLVEAGLSDWGSGAMMDLDVSYVNGYTVSVTCACNDDAKTWLAGCSEDLWAQNTCGADGETDKQDSNGVCINPTNDGTRGATAASPFFKPCEGKAYTFPADDKSNSEGKCLGGAATCCIGTKENGCPGSA